MSSQVVAIAFHYTASLDLDSFPEIFRSAIIGNYDWEKGPHGISVLLYCDSLNI